MADASGIDMENEKPKTYDFLTPDLAIHAMRTNGFKDTAHAIAELIDNSIQSGEQVPDRETNVEVICIERPSHMPQRTVYRVAEVCVFDNAQGMDRDTLRGAMQFGQGSNLETGEQTGIGKFGMGLPNSSISQCRRVDVYSWKDGACHKTYLDIDEIRAGKSREVPEPIPAEIPSKWKSIIIGPIEDSGTLVIWTKLDRTTWSRSKTFFKNSEFVIGRMYRHFIVDGRVKIRFAAHSQDGAQASNLAEDEMFVRPNDPLMLMKGTMAPAPFDKTPAFMEWSQPDELEVTLPNGSKPKVIIKYSVASAEARNTENNQNPGSTSLGNLVKKNVGVSIVRARRELEMNSTWNNPSEARERWLSVEVSFDPALDDVFGVTNNKQSATKLIRMDLDEDAEQEGLKPNDYLQHLKDADDPRWSIYMISNLITKRIRLMTKQIKDERRGANTAKRGVAGDGGAEARATSRTAERIAEMGEKGRSDQNMTASDTEKIGAVTEALVDSGVDEENAHRIAVASVEKKLRYFFVRAELASPAIFDVQEKSGELFIKMNTRHPAYEHVFEVLEESNDSEDDGEEEKSESPALTGLKLLLTAWARMEDEATEQELERLQDVRINWGKIARDFLREN
jgi:hypothetical protein